MEITDGGQAAQEYQSDYDDEVDYEGESNGEDNEQQLRESQSEEEGLVSDSEEDLEQPRAKIKSKVVDKRKVIETSMGDVRRQSVEQQLSSMSSTLEVMKDFFNKSGMMNPEGQPQNRTPKKGGNKSDISHSEMTVYRNALQHDKSHQVVVDSEITFKVTEDKQQNELRQSSSSEDRIDTSDEMMEVDQDLDFNDRFIADCAEEAARRKRNQGVDDQLPGTSGRMQAEDKIHQAEASRVKIYNFPGNEMLGNQELISCGQHALVFANQPTSVTDENYIVMGAHLDQSLIEKIQKGKYIAFARLLPREQGGMSCEGCMELIFKGGRLILSLQSTEKTMLQPLIVSVNGNRHLGYSLMSIQKHIQAGLQNSFNIITLFLLRLLPMSGIMCMPMIVNSEGTWLIFL